MVNDHGLLLWFYVDAASRAQIVNETMRDGQKTLDTLFAYYSFLSPFPRQGAFSNEILHSLSQSKALHPWFLPTMQMLDARLRGKTTEAYDISQGYFPPTRDFQPFADARCGWTQFLAVQLGTTAMLKGNLTAALIHFQDALMREKTADMEFLQREALIKSALIHAAFGDHREAAAHLDRARYVPRTVSWIEDSIDAAALLAEALNAHTAAVASQLLLSLDTSHIAEMWPFYVHAQHRVLRLAAASSLAAQKNNQLSSLPFPRTEGDGYGGSIFRLEEAFLCIESGVPRSARENLDYADQQFVLTRILQALVCTQTGTFAKAIRICSDLQASTLSLRRLELWRLAILAQAHLGLGHEEQALGSLRAAVSMQYPLEEFETTYFSGQLYALGMRHVDGWPQKTSHITRFMEGLPLQPVHLTEREYEVLVALSKGASRKEMASALFVSTNTVKSQLAAVYRKLGAKSRAEALRNAQNRGLL